jgi:hypothetical protein
MEKEFVPYDVALAMKELGFDEPCFGCYTKDKELSLDRSDNKGEGHYFQDCSAPLYQQAFRWFREEHGICGYVRRGSKIRFYYPPENGFTVDDWEWCVYKTDGEHLPGHGMKDTYEEAELACLRKLIEIVKENL